MEGKLNPDTTASVHDQERDTNRQRYKLQCQHNLKQQISRHRHLNSTDTDFPFLGLTLGI